MISLRPTLLRPGTGALRTCFIQKTLYPRQGLDFNSLSMKNTAVLLLAVFLSTVATFAAPIRVVVWDEAQPQQKEAYGGFLGDTLAKELSTNKAFTVKSVHLDDVDQGLPPGVLDHCDVLIWWGHKRHKEVKPELSDAIVERIKTGQISLLALHSAHWSDVFMKAMAARAIDDAWEQVPVDVRPNVKPIKHGPERVIPKKDAPMTPSSKYFIAGDGQKVLEIILPNCIFPTVRNDGTPSHLTTLLPDHPIAKGIPATFDIPKTEIYAGPFHVPKPDAVIWQEKWDGGEEFTSGCAWNVGKGKVFYFRPGHETYPIYKQEVPLKIIQNAVLWLGTK